HPAPWSPHASPTLRRPPHLTLLPYTTLFRSPAQSCAPATEGPRRRTTLSTHVRIAGCTPLGLRNRLEGGRTDDVAQQPRDVTNRFQAPVEENDRAQVQRREDDGDHHDAHQRRHRAGRPAERRESPDDHRGCGAGQSGGQHVLPDRVDDRGDAEARRPPRIPQRRNRENAEIRDPRRRDPERAPPEAEETQNGDHRELEDPPAEQAVSPSDGQGDPDLDEIDEYKSGRGGAERDMQTRLL